MASVTCPLKTIAISKGYGREKNVLLLQTEILIPDLLGSPCAPGLRGSASTPAFARAPHGPGGGYDLPGIRAWGDTLSESLEKSAIESYRQEMAANHGKLAPEANFLALSGGGGDGAFGAGILCGWTEGGHRPRFKLVTGISTGALIAPFAFLGSEYDAKLKEAYTTITDKDIYKVPSVVKLIINLGRIEAAASTQPLADCWSGSLTTT